jgi:hypothetical protein
MAGRLKPTNKEREAIYFQIFQKKYASFQKYKHTDNPDFLIFFDNETLGIEFTEIYKEEQVNGIKPRKNEAIKERIVYNACQKAIDFNLPPLRVSVLFSVHFSGTVKKERERIVTEELFNIVKDNCPTDGSNIELDFNNSIPDEFHAIRVYNIPGCKKHFWNYTEACFVYTSFSDQLQERISSKAEKLPEYLKHCNRCWLVIVALGLSGSSFYEFSDEMEKYSYKSPFEKVFFLDAFSVNLRELRLNNNS